MSKSSKSLKFILAVTVGASVGVGAHKFMQKDTGTLVPASLELEAAKAAKNTSYQTLYDQRFTPSGFAGNYLAGFFAQQNHDWKQADLYIEQSLDLDDANAELIKRGIVLAIAAGKYDEAFDRSKLLNAEHKDDSIGQLFLTVEAFKNKDDAKISKLLMDMNKGGIADFVKPLLKTWQDASNGKLNTKTLRKNTIHLMHGVLAAHYLDKKDQTENLLAEALALKGFTVNDLERAGDIYVSLDRTDKAMEIYEQVLKIIPSQTQTKEKLEKLKSGETIEGYTAIQSPQDGVAAALFDMAKLFYQEGADDSAHIFTHMSLSLNTDNTDAHLLLADIASRNDRYAEAIAYYQNIDPDHHYYLRTQRQIADLMEDSGRMKDAIAKLEYLAKDHGDLTALIQIGDIYRREEQFKKAIDAYNRAEKKIGKDNIIPDYWHLHYVRGMAYERHGNWKKAEKDLQTALDFKPDHPFVLNYLGYAWADQNKNLDKATEMIKKAVSLQPNDGYITDSLGWALYKQGKYIQAVVHLERAVELLPYDPVINDHLGDAYWKVGRKLEAKFQWERAKNHVENDDKLLTEIEDKLQNGMANSAPSIKQATSQTDDEKDKETLNP